MSATITRDTKTRRYPDYAAPLWRRLLFTRESAVILLLLAVIALLARQRGQLRRPADDDVPAPRHAPILLIALPMTLVIVTGEIDLSVASVVGLSSVLLGVLTDAGWSVPGLPA